MDPLNALPARIATKIEVHPETGCWLWTASLRNGYGQVHWRGKVRKAHRVVYEVVRGPIPSTSETSHGTCVCHTCDVPNCVNPAHLFIGTQLDNIADMGHKGRKSRGERHSQAQLTADQVHEIRALRGVERQVDLAARFGVSYQLVSAIQLGLRREFD